MYVSSVFDETIGAIVAVYMKAFSEQWSYGKFGLFC